MESFNNDNLILSYLMKNQNILDYFKDKIVSEVVFKSEYHQDLYDLLKKVWIRKQVIPAPQELEIMVEKLYEEQGELVVSFVKSIIKNVTDLQPTEITKDQLTELLLSSEIKKITQSLYTDEDSYKERIIKARNEFDKLLNLVEVGDYDDYVGYFPLDIEQVGERGKLYDELYGGKPIPTGYPRLDRYIRGGAPRAGDLIVLAAVTGGGKTNFVYNMAINIAKQGLRVIYYVLDNQIAELFERTDSNLLRVPSIDFINNEKKYTCSLKLILKNIDKTSLILKPLPPYQTKIGQIKQHINAVEEAYGKVDVIIVDSADHINSGRSYNDKRHELEYVYAELRGIAMEKKVLAVTPTQGNRTSLETEFISMKHVSESYSKLWSASLYLTLNQTYEERLTGNMRLVICKNTKGLTGIIIPLKHIAEISTVKEDETQEDKVIASDNSVKKSSIQTTSITNTAYNIKPPDSNKLGIIPKIAEEGEER